MIVQCIYYLTKSFIDKIYSSGLDLIFHIFICVLYFKRTFKSLISLVLRHINTCLHVTREKCGTFEKCPKCHINIVLSLFL